MVTPIANLTVAAAGTRVRLTSTQPDPSAPFPVHGVLIQARFSNTGKIYVGDSTLVGSTLTGILGQIAIPTANTIPSLSIALTLAPNAIDLAKLYLDAEVGGEGATISVLIA